MDSAHPTSFAVHCCLQLPPTLPARSAQRFVTNVDGVANHFIQTLTFCQF